VELSAAWEVHAADDYGLYSKSVRCAIKTERATANLVSSKRTTAKFKKNHHGFFSPEKVRLFQLRVTSGALETQA
jgi:hypothetical protein